VLAGPFENRFVIADLRGRLRFRLRVHLLRVVGQDDLFLAGALDPCGAAIGQSITLGAACAAKTSISSSGD